MKKSQLAKITTILPFDGNYIKVGKNRNKLWNLMDSEGNLVTETWFEEIERKNDGSIVAKNENKEVKFTNVNNFRKYDYTIKMVPACVMDLVDLSSIKPYENSDGYVATAKFYGRTVYIKADGRIFDTYGNELRILFNTVDTERLNNALVAFNKKMRYDFNPEIVDNSWETVHEAKQSIFGFYWINEDRCVNVGETNVLVNDAEKWTDDFIIRAVDKWIPESALEKLKGVWGEPVLRNENERDFCYSWHFEKANLDSIIDTLNNI